MYEREVAPIYDDEPIQEACGLISLYSSVLDTPRKVDLALRAAIGVQHRGQQGAGIAYPTREGVRQHVGNGLLTDVFTVPVVSDFTEENPGHWLQVHTRYGTDTQAGYTEDNLQPIIAYAPDGTQVSLIHNGQFTAKDDMRKKVHELSGQEYPDNVSDSFLAAQMVANSPGESWEERVIYALNNVDGAFSLSIGIKDMLFLARDKFGLRPHVVGRIGDGWIAASETRALKKIGVKTERSILRGEIARIDHRGLSTIQEGLEGQGNFCSFEVAYFSGPDSINPTFESADDAYHPERWVTNYEARKLTGVYLAKEMQDKLKNMDIVTAAPDSGVPFGTGLAIGAGIPYEPVIVRDHYDPKTKVRLFQGSNIDLIPGQVGGKLTFIPGSVKGKRIIISDDSMVRSSVIRELNRQAREEGAIEVHGAFGFPPVMKPCHLGVSMRTEEELIAARHKGDLDGIAQETGLDSVSYISFSGFIKALKNGGEVIKPRDIQNIFLENGGCGGCLTGRYPIDAQGVIFNEQTSK